MVAREVVKEKERMMFNFVNGGGKGNDKSCDDGKGNGEERVREMTTW